MPKQGAGRGRSRVLSKVRDVRHASGHSSQHATTCQKSINHCLPSTPYGRNIAPSRAEYVLVLLRDGSCQFEETKIRYGARSSTSHQHPQLTETTPPENEPIAHFSVAKRPRRHYYSSRIDAIVRRTRLSGCCALWDFRKRGAGKSIGLAFLIYCTNTYGVMSVRMFYGLHNGVQHVIFFRHAHVLVGQEIKSVRVSLSLLWFRKGLDTNTDSTTTPSTPYTMGRWCFNIRTGL